MNNMQAIMSSKYSANTAKSDFLASIVVFLIALPLCMGIAIASGAPVASGLITGIVGGLVVGMLAGSPLQVSGPAAGLTVIVFEIIQRHGLEVLFAAVLIGGMLQLAAGLLGWGQWFRAVSPAVIKGMLAGIGVLIFASQFHVMVDDRPKGSGIENLVTIPQAIAKGLSLPELEPRDARAIRIEQVRRIGELHRRQGRIHERAAEQLAAQESLAAAASDQQGDDQPATDGETLEALIADQEELVASLDAITTELQQLPESMRTQLKSDDVQTALAAALQQSQQALDDIRGGSESAILNSQVAATSALEDLLASLKSHSLAAGIGLLTIITILLWQGVIPQKWRVVPGPLVAVVLATAFAAIGLLPVIYVEVPDNFVSDLNILNFQALEGVSWLILLQSGLVIAAVASAETLLCATAVDQLHEGQRTQYNRELSAQGVGNILCGLLGALPMTGVIVRSSTNVYAGAQTRLSAILHGLWLLIFVVALGSLLRMVPTASLAAILVYTGYKLVNVKAIRELFQYGWGEVAVYATTVTMIVVTDLLTGVVTGIALAGLKLLFTFSGLKAKLEVDEQAEKAVLNLEGAATFMRIPALAAQLERVPRNAEFQMDIQRLTYIDHACLDLLSSWSRQHEMMGGQLAVDWDALHNRMRYSPLRLNGFSEEATAAEASGRTRELLPASRS